MKPSVGKIVLVEACFPSMVEARETMSELVAELGVEVNLVRGRVAPSEVRLRLEMRGRAANLDQGVRRLRSAWGRCPSRARAS